MVILRQQDETVGFGKDRRDVELAAGQDAVEGSVIVERQDHVLDVFVVQGDSAGPDRSVEGSFRVDAEPDVRRIRHVDAGLEEIQDGLGVMRLEMQVVGLAGPFSRLLPEEGRQFAADRDVLDVPDEIVDEAGADKGAFRKAGLETDPVDIVVDVGGDGNVADIVMPVHVRQLDVHDVDVADEVVPVDPVEVGAGAQAQAGGSAFVDVQGVQVGIAEVGIELIDSVFCLRREGEDTLEDEVQVRVAADDPAVEGIFGIGAGRGDAGIVVAQGMEPVDIEGINLDGRGFPGKGCLDGGVQGDRSDGIDTCDPAHVEVPGPEVAADQDRAFRIRYVPQVQDRIETAGPGGEITVDGQPVDGTRGRSVEGEGLARGIFVQPELDVRCPATDEFLQVSEGEGHVLDLVVQQHVLRIRQADQGSVHPGGDAAVQRVELEPVDVEVVDISMDFAFQVADQGHPAQGGGEIADGLEVEPAAAQDGAVKLDFLNEMAEGGHPVVGHLEFLEPQVAEQVPDDQVLDLRQTVADTGFAAHLVDGHAAFFAEREFVRDPFHDLAVHPELAALQVDVADVQVRPVDGVRRDFPGAVVVSQPEAEAVDLDPAHPEDFLVVGFLGLLGRFLPLAEDPFEVALAVRFVGQDEITVFDIGLGQVDHALAEQGGRTDPDRDVPGAGKRVERGFSFGSIRGAVDKGDVFQDHGVEGADVHFPDGNVTVDDSV